MSQVLLVLLCLDLVVAQQHSVIIELQLDTHTRAGQDCVGGDVGLTDTSVLLQYRLLSPTPQTWTTELAVSPNDTHMVRTISISESAQGVQFRMIQFEHGGGHCNCWTLSDMRITVNEEQPRTIPLCTSACTPASACDEVPLVFCGDNARDARGFITHAYYFNNTRQNMCPGDSNMLISNQGPPLPDNCANSTTRM